MMKRLAATGILTGAIGGVLFGAAAPAMAGDDDPSTVQIIGVQTCRGIDVAGIGAAIHNILGVTDESGDCVNGSTVVDRD
ncbi:hypothetical protein [Actinocorallia longicatena]|uniref:DUF320 domain-containing protein n=1 Tax=Actinocorallia longicatena TaxID=111803 RepID=A0ABP6QGP1_9ACTN